jgi:hypothetical protein
LSRATTRFGKVSTASARSPPPKGSEEWYLPGFDPQSAGWKKGFAPFANVDGKLVSPAHGANCVGPNHYCGCGNPPNTFWDKEALLMRVEIELPPLEDGYAYRLLVGGRAHYNMGGGSKIWFDGEYLPNPRKDRPTIEGGGGRGSDRPWGVVIDDKHRKHFEDGKVLLATNSFLRWGHRSEKIYAYRTLWFEKMKLPAID